MLEDIKFFCRMFGVWSVFSKMALGLFGRVLWWVLRLPPQAHTKMLKEHLSSVIQRWYFAEKKQPLDPSGQGVFLICGFLIYAYSQQGCEEELTYYCLRTIECKKNWIAINH